MDKIVLRGMKLTAATARSEEGGIVERFSFIGDLSYPAAERLGISEHFFDEDGSLKDITGEVSAKGTLKLEALQIEPNEKQDQFVECVAVSMDWEAYTIVGDDPEEDPGEARLKAKFTVPTEAGDIVRDYWRTWGAAPCRIDASPKGQAAGQAQQKLDLGEAPKRGRGRPRKQVPEVANVVPAQEAEAATEVM